MGNVAGKYGEWETNEEIQEENKGGVEQRVGEIPGNDYQPKEIPEKQQEENEEMNVEAPFGCVEDIGNIEPNIEFEENSIADGKSCVIEIESPSKSRKDSARKRKRNILEKEPEVIQEPTIEDLPLEELIPNNTQTNQELPKESSPRGRPRKSSDSPIKSSKASPRGRPRKNPSIESLEEENQEKEAENLNNEAPENNHENQSHNEAPENNHENQSHNEVTEPQTKRTRGKLTKIAKPTAIIDPTNYSGKSKDFSAAPRRSLRSTPLKEGEQEMTSINKPLTKSAIKRGTRSVKKPEPETEEKTAHHHLSPAKRKLFDNDKELPVGVTPKRGRKPSITSTTKK